MWGGGYYCIIYFREGDRVETIFNFDKTMLDKCNSDYGSRFA